MVLITQSGLETLPIGSQAPAFNLPATDGKTYSLDSLQKSKAVVLSFTCNHCPYAQAYDDRFNDLAREFTPKGFSFIAINANDAMTYPDDSFENMIKHAKVKNFTFPYLHDKSHRVAKAYGAVCTPHIFVLDEKRKLVYEGRIDDNWKNPDAVTSHDLKNALNALATGQPIPAARTNPMGCSIKWKRT